ncbi:MAG: hypothetical protein AAF652_15175 [Cyanobacteria bacterium P01_C01_bin.72]
MVNSRQFFSDQQSIAGPTLAIYGEAISVKAEIIKDIRHRFDL